MIPADRWRTIGDGSAWMVLEADEMVVRECDNESHVGAYLDDHDRPCGTCGGVSDIGPLCPACDGTGRHTFWVNVEQDWGYQHDHRVHVLGVLPIADDGDFERYVHCEASTLPASASVGMWAVRVAVHD